MSSTALTRSSIIAALTLLPHHSCSTRAPCASCHMIEVELAGGVLPQLDEGCHHLAPLLSGLGTHGHDPTRPPAVTQSLREQAGCNCRELADELFDDGVKLGAGVRQAGARAARRSAWGRSQKGVQGAAGRSPMNLAPGALVEGVAQVPGGPK